MLVLLIECVAQLVEHLTFNQVAEGSNPSALTNEIKDLQKIVSPCFLFNTTKILQI